MDALHSICRSKSSFLSFKQVFPSLSITNGEKRRKALKILTYTLEYLQYLWNSSYDNESYEVSKWLTHNTYFLHFFFFQVCDGKGQETCLNADEDFFDQQSACEAPVCWLRYKTISNHQNNFYFLFSFNSYYVVFTVT